jgi:hypothetical protein
MERPLEIYRIWKQVLGSDREGSPVASYLWEVVREIGDCEFVRLGDPLKSPRKGGPIKNKQKNSGRVWGTRDERSAGNRSFSRARPGVEEGANSKSVELGNFGH